MPSALMQTLWPGLPPVSSSLWLTSILTTVLSKSSSTPAVGYSVASHPISASSALWSQTFAALRGILTSEIFFFGTGGGQGTHHLRGDSLVLQRLLSENATLAVADGDVWVFGCRLLRVPPRLNSHPKVYVWGQLSPTARNEP